MSGEGGGRWWKVVVECGEVVGGRGRWWREIVRDCCGRLWEIVGDCRRWWWVVVRWEVVGVGGR